MYNQFKKQCKMKKIFYLIQQVKLRHRLHQHAENQIRKQRERQNREGNDKPESK